MIINKKRCLFYILFASIACCLAFTEGNSEGIDVPKGWAKPAYDFSKNLLTKEKIALGRRLFYDPILSKDSTISCASCHLQATAFTHIDHDLSHGINNRIGKRNSPALVNLAWNTAFMWDGAVNQLDRQALAPMTNADEMGDTLPNILHKLQRSTRYKTYFNAAYNSTNITTEGLLHALSAFMLTLVSANSKYDKVMRKTDSFNAYEAKGYAVFLKNCNSCHTAPLFTNNQFENNGLQPDNFLLDSGRMGITKQAADALKFKVPSLRNIEVSYPYMHDGRFKNLQMVVFHYTNTLYDSPTLSPILKTKITLSETDKINLIAFLKTLTDESFLQNKDFSYLP
ncbi:MAG: hypothetical protein RI894_2595 [Bacteroidota bacterium]